ncbi:peptidoglycan D,D-transpeptidase FtsI family protein [Klenkia brasiliensis]|uniref:Cell elongation-specific peptidoglycan D,D-transpeptidase n=1 Tax=Klenkia brasiliensis TaxID=333142 RepID=A0A1G7XPP7_9ACTN|nr:penicillin-binding protein 2 [Klenkia brasiliensis]SDG86189.1 cell elongation-specific peptidoglycan D,D-transpeptidase [Klenkia brasiliensis]
MNSPLRKVAISVLVLFTLLILNANYIQVVRSSELRANPSNTRILAEEYDRERGAIVVAGNPVAQSVATDDTLTYLRQYPNAEVYSTVTGYYSLVYGNSGIERAENDILSGSDDRLAFRRIADLFTGRDPSGGNVELTLDPAAQQAAFDALGGVDGAVVALDPRTGAVLAMVSSPGYDPNQLSSHDPAAIRAYSDQLSTMDPDPRTNATISERHSPGSVFKLITSAAALQDGYTPDTVVPAPQQYVLPGTSRPLNNYNGESCAASGEQPLIDALTISCNTAFAELGVDLGEDRIRATAEAFGIDQGQFDMPLTVAESTVGDIDGDAQLAVASIGQQNVQITPLQGAMIAAAIANDGTLMTPYLVDQLQAPDLSVVDQTEPTEMGQPVSAEVAGQLQQMMVSVVENGSGRRAQIDGYTVGGKTGTAQTTAEDDDNQWFVGYAGPDGDPQIAVAVFIQGGQGTGGDLSAPVAQQVMSAYLAARGGN